jgi:hypothetical protein
VARIFEKKMARFSVSMRRVMVKLALAAIRLVNWLLRLLPRRCRWLQFRFSSLQQRFLLNVVLRDLLISMPPTGLGPRGVDAQVFRDFCWHVMTVFLRSPRCQLLIECNSALRDLVDTNEDVRWLVVDAMNRRNPPCVSIFAEKLDVKAGSLRRQWASLNSRATEKDKPLDVIRAGLFEKFKQAAVVDERLDSIVKAHAEQKRKARRSADELWPSVQTDAQYLRWRRANEVYERFVVPLITKYRVVDAEVGRDRNTSGAMFEAAANDAIVAIACERLCVSVEDVAYFTGVHWVDGESSAAACGEIDILVTSSDVTRVRCLIELKSHPFEIVSGYFQQAEKCVPGRRIVIDETHSIEFREGCQWPVFVGEKDFCVAKSSQVTDECSDNNPSAPDQPWCAVTRNQRNRQNVQRRRQRQPGPTNNLRDRTGRICGEHCRALSVFDDVHTS